MIRRALAAAAVTAAVGVGVGTVDAAPIPPPPEPDPLVEMAARKLQSDTGLPITTARRRIKAQPALEDTSNRLRRKAGKDWAGSYIDHKAGRLVALSKRPELVAEPGVTAKKATYSLAELNAVRNRVAMTRDDWSLLSVDQPSNTVRMWVDQPTGTAMERSAAPSGPVVVENRPGQMVGRDCSGFYSMCDPPLRGGVVMRKTNGRDWCTLGFTARSMSDGRVYAVTAGHCYRNGDLWWEKFVAADHNIHNVGAEHNMQYSTSLDAGIIAVQNVRGWNPKNYVYIKGSYHTSRAETYTITARGSSVVGSYLCKAAAHGSACGRVQALDDWPGYRFAPVTYKTRGLGRLDMGTCGGDSGGAIIAGHPAYGILTAGQNKYQAWLADDYMGWGAWLRPNICNATPLWYQGLAEIEARLGVRVLR